MNVFLIDNYDSFTYNLSLLVKHITGKRPVVKRNDELIIEELADYDKLLLSPGPGLPVDAGLLLSVVTQYAATTSILGICLGHQAIGQVFGARLKNMEEVFHGKSTKIIPDKGTKLFCGLDDPFEGGRYHSWVIDESDFPETLLVTARDEQGQIMAVRHIEYDVQGIQFHPESVLTPGGRTILSNWLQTK